MMVEVLREFARSSDNRPFLLRDHLFPTIVHALAKLTGIEGELRNRSGVAPKSPSPKKPPAPFSVATSVSVHDVLEVACHTLSFLVSSQGHEQGQGQNQGKGQRGPTIPVDVAGADDPFVVLNMLRLLDAADAGEPSDAGNDVPFRDPTPAATGPSAGELRAKTIRRQLTRVLMALSYGSPANVLHLAPAVSLLLDEAADESLGWEERTAALQALLNLSKIDELRPCLMDNNTVWLIYSISNHAPREIEVRVLGLEILANMAGSQRCVEDMVTQGVADYLDEVVAINKRVVAQAQAATKWALAAKASMRDVDNYMPMAEREKLATSKSRRRVTMTWAKLRDGTSGGANENDGEDDVESLHGYQNHWSVSPKARGQTAYTGGEDSKTKKHRQSFQAQYFRVLKHGVRVQLHWDSQGEVGHGSAPRLMRFEQPKRRSYSDSGEGGVEEEPTALLFEPTNQSDQMVSEHGHHEWSNTIMYTTTEQKLTRMRCPLDMVVRIQREPSETTTFFQIICTDRHLLVEFRDHDMCELVATGLEAMLLSYMDGELQSKSAFEERVEHYDRELRRQSGGGEYEDGPEGGEYPYDETYYPEDTGHRQQETYLYSGSETQR